MNMHESYFSFTAAYNPLPFLDRWLNPFNNSKTVQVSNHAVPIEWTERAEKKLAQRTTSLIVEMQIYFSCVVKKRVLFYESTGLETTTVNDKLDVCFRAVESNSCDPVEFASNFPIKHPFESAAAAKMHPKKLSFDYKDGEWSGEFSI